MKNKNYCLKHIRTEMIFVPAEYEEDEFYDYCPKCRYEESLEYARKLKKQGAWWFLCFPEGFVIPIKKGKVEFVHPEARYYLYLTTKIPSKKLQYYQIDTKKGKVKPSKLPTNIVSGKSFVIKSWIYDRPQK
jgi:hypothetical protein